MSQYNSGRNDESRGGGDRRSSGSRSNGNGQRGFNSRGGSGYRGGNPRNGSGRGFEGDREDRGSDRGGRGGRSQGGYRGNGSNDRRDGWGDRREGDRRSSDRRDGDRRQGGDRRDSDRRGYDRGDRNGSDRGGYRGNGQGGRRFEGQRGDRDQRRSYDDRRDDRRGGDRDDRRSYGDRDNRRSYGGRDDRRDDRRGGNRDDRRGGGDRGGRQGGRDGGRDFKHANRAGANRAQHSGPQRSGFREERINNRINEPSVPEDIDPRELDPSVRQELRSLAKDNADMVAKHLIMTAVLLDEDPEKALKHARAAKDRAGRVSVARETNGIAAYHAGEWKEAIAELRAARRMSGGPGLLAVLADAERGLGRPEKALEVGREEGAEELDAESRVELAIVLAGAHHDLEDKDAALITLHDVLEVPDVPEVTRMRLFYAYADALELLDRKDEAIEWFESSMKLDTEEMMDTPDRLAALRGESPQEAE